MILYHFTSTYHLALIKTAGYLKPTESNISFETEHAGPPVVWLTTADDVSEQTWMEGSVVDKRRIRITVDIDAAPWAEWSRKHGIDPVWYGILADKGGDPDTWYVHRGKVTRANWLEIKDMKTGKVLWTKGVRSAEPPSRRLQGSTRTGTSLTASATGARSV